MVMTSVWVCFGDSESEEGHREKFEGIFGGGTISDTGKEGFLFGSGFGIGR